jgi:hypothetical protein
MGIDYAWEKFFSALYYAIGSSDTLQKRLEGVISGVQPLQRDDFLDQETWKKFEELLRETTKRPAAGDEGTIRATTSRMSDTEATKWLHEALSLFSTIAEQYGKRE